MSELCVFVEYIRILLTCIFTFKNENMQHEILEQLVADRRKRARLSTERVRAILARGLLSDSLIRYIMLFLDHEAVALCSAVSMTMYGVVWAGIGHSWFADLVKVTYPVIHMDPNGVFFSHGHCWAGTPFARRGSGYDSGCLPALTTFCFQTVEELSRQPLVIDAGTFTKLYTFVDPCDELIIVTAGFCTATHKFVLIGLHRSECENEREDANQFIGYMNALRAVPAYRNMPVVIFAENNGCGPRAGLVYAYARAFSPITCVNQIFSRPGVVTTTNKKLEGLQIFLSEMKDGNVRFAPDVVLTATKPEECKTMVADWVAQAKRCIKEPGLRGCKVDSFSG